MDPKSPPETFHWSDCLERLEPLANEQELLLEPKGRYFEAAGLRVWTPRVYPVPPALQSAAGHALSAEQAAARRKCDSQAPDLKQYLAVLPGQPRLQCLILMQAGATAVGMFDGGLPLATKSRKRYVVRGKGRAQPAFLQTRGKSRYGSRLRLQNARLLIEELNAKLVEYWEHYGSPEWIFAAAPTRLWPDLWRAKLAPPFSPEELIGRVPLDLPVPTTDVLLRTYKSLCYGRIEAL